MTKKTDKLVPLKHVLATTGLSRSTVYRRSRDGNFPSPYLISSGSIRWKDSELQAWLDGLSKRRY
jgi:prophage regulatory protein